MRLARLPLAVHLRAPGVFVGGGAAPPHVERPVVCDRCRVLSRKAAGETHAEHVGVGARDGVHLGGVVIDEDERVRR